MTVGEGAFGDCRRVRTVKLPIGLMDVRFDRRAGGPRAKLTIDADVREVRQSPAFRIFGLKKVSFASGSYARQLCAGAFAETPLEKFQGPEKLWGLGPMAFFGCERLKSVRLKQQPENISRSVFIGTQVREVRIPPRLGKRVPVNPVRLCDLEEIEFPDGL